MYMYVYIVVTAKLNPIGMEECFCSGSVASEGCRTIPAEQERSLSVSAALLL